MTSVTVVTPAICVAPPTFKLRPIPTPPATCSAPLLVDVELVTLVTVVMPAVAIPPPTFTFSPTPNPPATVNAPELVDVEFVEPVIETVPVKAAFTARTVSDDDSNLKFWL